MQMVAQVALVAWLPYLVSDISICAAIAAVMCCNSTSGKSFNGGDVNVCSVARVIERDLALLTRLSLVFCWCAGEKAH